VQDVRAGRGELARVRLRKARLTPRDWLTAGRPLRRSIGIGSPLGEDGEYLVPDWRHFRPPDSAPGEAAPTPGAGAGAALEAIAGER
jgi:hypothetical protein